MGLHLHNHAQGFADMSGGGKSRKQETEVKLPKSLEKAAEQGLNMAQDIAHLPYAPNFGLTTAAFTPTQEAAFANTNQAASAFGLPQSSETGLPKAQNVNGFSGYSTKDLYNNSMAQMDPKARAMYEKFLANPYNANIGPGQGGGAGGAGGGSVSGQAGKNSGNGIIGSALNARTNMR
jgi:hypothetical protein